MATTTTLDSHKRTSSAAGNTAPAPQTKRQIQETVDSKEQTPNSSPGASSSQYVYIVVVDSAPQYGECTSDIHAVYATVKDANNAVKALANDYGDPEQCSYGTKDDGSVYWISGDAGEGERVELRIEKMEIMEPGSEPECEWGDFDMASGDEYGNE